MVRRRKCQSLLASNGRVRKARIFDQDGDGPKCHMKRRWQNVSKRWAAENMIETYGLNKHKHEQEEEEDGTCW